MIGQPSKEGVGALTLEQNLYSERIKQFKASLYNSLTINHLENSEIDIVDANLPIRAVVDSIIEVAGLTNNLPVEYKEKDKFSRNQITNYKKVLTEGKYPLWFGFDLKFAAIGLPVCDDEHPRKVVIFQKTEAIRERINVPILNNISSLCSSSKKLQESAVQFYQEHPFQRMELKIKYEKKTKITKGTIRQQIERTSPFRLVVRKGERAALRKTRGYHVDQELKAMIKSRKVSIYRDPDNEKIELGIIDRKDSVTLIVISSNSLYDGVKPNRGKQQSNRAEITAQVD